MHVKILHRHVHDYMYIDTCDIYIWHIYIYTHCLVLVGLCDALQSWARRFLVDLAAAKRHLAMVERCAIPSTSRRSIGRVGMAFSGKSQCTGKLGIGHQNWCINDYVSTYSNKEYILYAHRFTKIAKIHWDSIKASRTAVGCFAATHGWIEDTGPGKIAQGFCRPKRKVETKMLYIAHKDTHLYSIHLFCKYLYLHIQDTHVSKPLQIFRRF